MNGSEVDKSKYDHTLGESYQFRIAFWHPMPWLGCSQAHIDSAEALRNSIAGKEKNIYSYGISCVALMLYGLAIENLLKAIWIKQNPNNVVAKDFEPKNFTRMKDENRNHAPVILPKELQEHALNKLADLCGLSLSNRERDVLGFLTDYVEWRGRYPTPTKSNKKTVRRPSDDKIMHMGCNLEKLFEEGVLQMLVKRLATFANSTSTENSSLE